MRTSRRDAFGIVKKNKAIFLDRDGTINIEKNYLYKIADFEYLDGAIEGLRMMLSMGFLLILVTNQSGIGRGLYTELDFLKLDAWMKQDLEEKGVVITDTFYCPHYKDSIIKKYAIDCDCRKPKLGLFKKAVEKYNIDLSQSFAIGDKKRDLSICFVSDCRGFLICKSNDYLNNELTNVERSKVECCSSLLDCAKKIEKLIE